MEKKDLDWSGLGFGYRQTEKRYVTNYKDGAWLCWYPAAYHIFCRRNKPTRQGQGM